MAVDNLLGDSGHIPEPTEAEVLGMAEDYGQWMWDAGYLDDPRGESLVDKAAFKREEIKQALEAALHDAYAEGRADEREAIAQLCDEEAKEMKRQGDGCKDGRHEWMAQGVEALADTLRGISSATGRPADPILAAGWLPIESAPEDENVLVATQGGFVDTAFWTDEGDGPKWWWLVSANEHAKHPLHPNLTPTHWMPLPKHPKANCTHAWQMVQYGATYHDLRCSICGETKRETWD